MYALTLLAGLRINVARVRAQRAALPVSPRRRSLALFLPPQLINCDAQLFVPLMRRARHTEFLEFPWSGAAL